MCFSKGTHVYLLPAARPSSLSRLIIIRAGCNLMWTSQSSGTIPFAKSFCMHCCQLTIISALECWRRRRNKPPIKYPAILILWQGPGLGNLQHHALRQEWRLVSLRTSDPSCLHCTGWGEWKNKQQNLYGMMCTYISAMFMIVAATLPGSLGISPGCEMGLSSLLQNVSAVH